jgi:hypothetical protein
MQHQETGDFPENSPKEENLPDIIEANEPAVQEDTDPPLDEEDLEENDLTVEEADQIVWDPPKAGSAGPEEKDLTD